MTDSAKDDRMGYPHSITIAGYGDSEWVKLRQRLYEKLGRIQAERMMLENWLDSVQDPELRIYPAVAVHKRSDAGRNRAGAGV